MSAKDLILGIIGQIGTDGATGYVVEYAGEAVRGLSMEGRMTLCNMSIEAGARAGMVAPDETTFAYIKGRRFAPQGATGTRRSRTGAPALRSGRALRQSRRDRRREACPIRDLGNEPRHGGRRERAKSPKLTELKTDADRSATERMLEYMGLKPARRVEQIPIDRVFIGSCTNSRIEDLRAAARVAKGHHVSAKVRAMVVPGSQTVKHAAEQEGLDKIFQEAGFEWRESGCSMCLGMNPDILQPGERCASTSNRNFEGRQGRGGRTHLVSPMMAPRRRSPGISPTSETGNSTSF